MPERETWILAVSGGVDSAVLLDMLVESQTANLVVAHVDHGIREDSGEDVELVRQTAANYELPFEVTHLKLGKSASEQLARHERYAWLDELRDKYNASAVVTAHHQDDLLETIIINLQRGTGWRGLCSLRETKARKRPMLNLSKASIVSYAIERGLEWREDSTNDDLRYQRNYIRNGAAAKIDHETRRKLIRLYSEQLILRHNIDNEISHVLENVVRDRRANRYWLIMVSEDVAHEALKRMSDYRLLGNQLSSLLLFAKTAKPGATHESGSGVTVRATTDKLIFDM